MNARVWDVWASLIALCCGTFTNLSADAFKLSKSSSVTRCRNFVTRALHASGSAIPCEATVRIGLGYDLHRLVAADSDGNVLTLGGVQLDNSGFLVVGHSDGDVVLHAIADAVLGSVGLGDIGDYFSDTDPGNKGIASSGILRFTLEEARKQGYKPSNVDATIILQRPKLGAKLKERIRCSILEILGNTVTVNVKAKTNEGLDSLGASKAIACQAIVLMKKIP